jgi:Glycosyl hydrolase family 26
MRVLGTFAVAAVVAAAAATGGTAGAGSRSPSETVRSLRTTRSVLFGVAAESGGSATAPLTRVAGSVGKTPALFGSYVSFASPNFDRRLAESIRSQGAIPLITWEAWSDGALGREQPRYALARFLHGDFDGYIRHWAEGARDWGGPLLLRFAPEMNADWNSWSAGINGNSAAEYVAVWRRVHGLFDRVGARNVQWVWSPNVSFPGSTPLRPLYPGDRFVDWVGIDGYNWGTSRPGTRWRTFDQVFAPTIRSIRRLTSKPLMLAEVGSAEQGGNKARWISQFFASLPRYSDIFAFVWFDYDKEADWRLDSSAAARVAFAAGIADRRYRGAKEGVGG